ncbi:glutathione S-transferase family protein [Massilia sp. S19_KUP03_FR1]|uniref:glutathione S-transferase family protein n=1 Tax=Massilia sp. S19_KUP03_FR1 TaxID=3025503 RepID=UPI002FCDA36E
MLKILGKASSINVRKVLWTCDELDLPFFREDWGVGFQSTSEAAFLAMNPNAQVPVLVDRAFVMWESNAICRYLATQYGGSRLLPAFGQQKALVEQWMDWQATEFNNAWRYAFMALVRNSPAHQDSAQVGASIAAWHRHVGIIDQHLSMGTDCMVGNTFTPADIVIGLSLARWQAAPIEHPIFPAVDAYLARLAQRPGYQAWAANFT